MQTTSESTGVTLNSKIEDRFILSLSSTQIFSIFHPKTTEPTEINYTDGLELKEVHYAVFLLNMCEGNVTCEGELCYENGWGFPPKL